MRFLVDESTGPAVARWLQKHEHDATSIYDEAPGMSDRAIVRKALNEDRILITNDKDFGEKVFREGEEHCGVILLRLKNERAANKINVLEQLLADYAQRLPDNFVVVTEKQVRFARRKL